ncbi:MAG: ATP-binding protein [Candidatus Methanoplasma sp.]|jgi:predicted AAA+ superfamily ATPase|nr:ATP-binding protein [Candidatus Methanoplasma sp.]
MTVKTVLRRDYLKRLRDNKDDTRFVKVITGIRRCGKSTLMAQFADELRSCGVPDDRIVQINLESIAFLGLTDGKALAYHLNSVVPKERTYVFIDEIQRVEHWEVAVNSLMVDRDADIYVTGSNAFLLSGELATYLTGRYVRIDMFPLSFREYCELHGDDKHAMFNRYMKNGSFPMIDPKWDEATLHDHIIGLYSTIVLNDVMTRGGIRDGEQLERVVRFLFDNVGNPVSTNNISEMLKPLSRQTVERFLKLLTDSYIMYEATPYDLRGKRILSSGSKYYVADTGMRNAVLSFVSEDYGRLMENIVYLELRRRGCSVLVGRCHGMEIDFVARRGDAVEYIQVTYSMLDEKHADRELRSLRAAGDSRPKTVISADRLTADFSDGIKHTNIVDWLLDA